jgi:hypothetical protein
MYEKTFPIKVQTHTSILKTRFTTETIFDLGVPNPFSKFMEQNGYTVKTQKERI